MVERVLHDPRGDLDEAARLEALRRYRILDTPPEADFDDLAQLAGRICDAPIALVSLVDRHRQWFKSHVGLDTCETPREASFCAHAIRDPPELLVIPDAREDPRFRDNDLVTGPPHIRFYAGAPLVTRDGHALGTLCVIDRKPRTLEPRQEDALRKLASQVVSQLELRASLRRLEDASIREAQNRQLIEAQNEVLQSIARDRPLEETLDLLVRLLEGQSGGMLASIHVYDEDTETLQLAAAPHLPADVRAEAGAIPLRTDPRPCPRAVRTRQQVVTEDIRTDPRWAHARGPLEAHGIRCCWSTPVLSAQDDVLGTFALFGKTPGRPGTEEQRILSLAAQLVRLAIEQQRHSDALEEARRQGFKSEKLALMGSLVAGVAHEIRTPLTYLANNLHLLERRLDRSAEPAALDTDVRPLTKDALEAVTRINHLVRSLRKFTRHDNQDFREAEIGEVVEDAVELFRRTHRGAIHVVHHRAAPPKVRVDPIQIQQVVINLLENAAAASPSGATVEVRTEADGEDALIRIRDEGAGIPEASRENLFEPFFTTREEGTGLGLNIVKRIVTAHGGDIDYESHPGAGTTFHVHIPARSPPLTRG